MGLHSLFEELLSDSDVGFGSIARDDSVASGFIHDYGLSAVVVVVASSGGFGLAVAFTGSEIKRHNISIQLGHHVSIEDLT